jgi:hypothetical protein
MPRPGFYNDNEYRAYPFIDKQVTQFPRFVAFPAVGNTATIYIAVDTGGKFFWTGTAYAQIPSNLIALPTNAVLDAGFIMGLDANYDDATDSVWLWQIKKSGSVFEFVFKTTATDATVSFFKHDSGDWALEQSDSAIDADNPCAEEPIWSGFFATGSLADLTTAFNLAAVSNTWSLQTNYYVIEPARIQNLNKAYLRSVSVGNFARVVVPPCDVTTGNNNRPIVLNSRCMKGDIRLKEGYNCLITQTDRANELAVTAANGAGAGGESAELCENNGELPLYPGETPPADSKFYSGGPACNELIATINGVGGPNVNLVGGAGVNILIDDGALVVQKKPNAQVNCT